MKSKQKLIKVGETKYSIRLKCNKCGCEQSINKIHYDKSNMICNYCADLNNDEYYYNYNKGVSPRSERKSTCKICNEKDILTNMTSIEKKKEKKNTVWYYHEQCIKNIGQTKDGIAEIINKSFNKKAKDIEVNKPININKPTLTHYNFKKIKENYGDIIKTPDGFGLKIINKSCNCFNMQMKNVAGVYCIKNMINKKHYIGSSANLVNRIKSHNRGFKKIDHDNHRIREDIKKYGVDSFELYVLEILIVYDKDILHLTEQKYIDLLDSYNTGYNIHPIAGFYGNKNDYIDLFKA